MEFLHSYSIILGLKPQNSVNVSLFSTFSVKSLSTINTQYSILNTLLELLIIITTSLLLILLLLLPTTTKVTITNYKVAYLRVMYVSSLTLYASGPVPKPNLRKLSIRSPHQLKKPSFTSMSLSGKASSSRTPAIKPSLFLCWTYRSITSPSLITNLFLFVTINQSNNLSILMIFL